MGKVDKRVSKTRSKLSINTYKRPMIFVILMMVMINIGILIVAAFVAMLIDDNYTSFIDAFGNGSLKWMLTPNAILSVENPQTLALAVVVLIIGMVLFSGTIIALTTNQIKEYFNKKKRGSGKIYLDDHIVILNWNDKVPELVADLLHVESVEYTVMILADVDKHYAEKQILNAINKHGKGKMTSLNVLMKMGDPLIPSYLYDVSIEHAKAVIVMNKDLHQEVIKDMSKSDLNVIKTILNLSNIEYTYKPAIVAEVKNIESKQKIETMSKVVKNLHPHTVLPVCFDRRLGQIVAQTIIHSLMEDVYLSMFSFGGAEVYLSKHSFEESIKYSSQATPLAHHRGGSFVLSENNLTKDLQEKHDYNLKDLKAKNFEEATSLEVFIVDENNKLEFIIESFVEYEKLYNIGFNAKCIKSDEIEEMTEYVNSSDKKVKIVLLSDEFQETDSLDANVLDNLIKLQGLLTREDVTVIVELLDPRNARIIQDFNINNTIISNKIISLLLSKLALFPETASFYENLLTLEIDTSADDHEIIIRKASDVFDEKFPITFESKKQCTLSSYTALKDMLVFGVSKQRDHVDLFHENLFDGPLVIEADDNLIIMKI